MSRDRKRSSKKKSLSLAAIILAAAYFLLTGELPETFSNVTGVTQGQLNEKNVVSSGKSPSSSDDVDYEFRSRKLWMDHFEKHGDEMGYETADEYLDAANDVIDDPDVLHKTEKGDGDDIYYLEDSNEFVVVSKDGYLRTYFEPSDGMDYYERQ